jgi:hypothetical protein
LFGALKIADNVSGLAEVPHATLFKYMHNLSCGIFGKLMLAAVIILMFA